MGKGRGGGGSGLLPPRLRGMCRPHSHLACFTVCQKQEWAQLFIPPQVLGPVSILALWGLISSDTTFD